MHTIRQIALVIFGIILLTLAIIVGCSKTIILNKVEEDEEYVKQTRADTTARDMPPMQEDTLHEITFQPMIEAWVISQGDTLKI